MRKEELFWIFVSVVCIAILKQIFGFESTVIGLLVALGFKD